MHEVSPVRVEELPEAAMAQPSHRLPAVVLTGTDGVLKVPQIRDGLHGVDLDVI